ncbi:WD40-repeat-containing domain protein [Paraphysoderma sedebokerense]|nr:WD40-repeat-containing domain protein [Paraphysoderma sedebokerense]
MDFGTENLKFSHSVHLYRLPLSFLIQRIAIFIIMDSDGMQKAPSEISFQSQVFDVAYHPSQNIIACGLLSGDVHCYNYSIEKNTRLFASKHHKKSCRSVAFSHDGNHLFTASKDKSIQMLDMATYKVVLKKGSAHDNPINKIINMDEKLLATGDEDGVVKIWDIRQKNLVKEYHDNEDFIADMVYVPEKKKLLVAGGDGFLSVFDFRKEEIIARSDNQEDELLSIVTVKNNKKVVVGTQEGTLNIFSWGWWGDMKDRFPGHPASVDCMTKINEDIIVTGSSDGLIRVLTVHPNNLLGILNADQSTNEDDLFPVENLAVSFDKEYLASSSHDQVVRFWNIRELYEEDKEEDDEVENVNELTKDGESVDDDGWEDVDSEDSDTGINRGKNSVDVGSSKAEIDTTGAEKRGASQSGSDWGSDSDDEERKKRDKKKRKKAKTVMSQKEEKVKKKKLANFFQGL